MEGRGRVIRQTEYNDKKGEEGQEGEGLMADGYGEFCIKMCKIFWF